MLGINAWNESQDTVARFARDGDLKHTLLLDGGATAGLYKVSGVPQTFWINGDGIIVDAESGFSGAAGLNDRTRKLVEGR